MVDVERVLLERNVPIPLRDGTLTYANVWRPAGGDPVPAIMVRTPYTKEVEEINVFSEPRVAAVRGFAIVSQDVRGRGESEGEFDPYFQEGADGYDSIEHVAGLDWCSGDVVMAGNSYVGATQWLAAVEAPPSLRAIAPGLTPDAYDEGWTFHSGVLELAFIHSWIAGIFGPQDRLWLDDVERSYTARDELIEFAPWCEPWFREAIGSPYWERCSIAARRDAVRVPALSIGGWHDTFLDGTLRNFAADRNPRSRLIIGPWGHDDWLTHLVGDRNLGVAGSGDAFGLFDRELEFYSAAIAGEDPPMARVSAYMLGARRWLELESWPPPGSEPVSMRSPGRRSITTPRTCRPPSAGGSSRSTRRAAPAGASSTSAPWPPILVSRSWSSARLRRNGWRAPCAPAWRPHRPAAIRPTGCAPSACATATARFSTCARGSRGPRRARPRSRSTSGTSASSCPRAPSSACSSPGRATRAGSRSGSPAARPSVPARPWI